MANTYEFCQVERDEHLLIVHIDRQEVYNAVHPPANDEMSRVFDAFQADDTLWVAIITGAGDKAFCTGNDLKYHGSGQKMWIPESGFGGISNRFDLEKPVIAAVNGMALGGGFEIAAACDIIIASDRAKFGLPEPKVGLIAAAGGIQRIADQIGRKAANEILLTGRHLSAEEAYRYGIINRIVPHEKLMEAAKTVAGEILECSPTSIRATKRILNGMSESTGFLDSLKHTAPVMRELQQTEDFKEGIQAFVEKRKPEWKNR